MMKKLVSKRMVAVLVVVMFAISFAGIGVCEEAQEAQVTVVMGTITTLNADTGQVMVQDESGEIQSLAGADADLKDLNTGDLVIIECDSEKNIKSIAKQEPIQPESAQ
ncbi:MAG: hypothetical protein BA872_08235 [Desulfobacterales bacterium C00003060]|nr:MAG: hypothetical protein BA861_06210 [Desulfobacterales bacterium S3730MH5]OEU76878.1 MAG: hypothetical protein BA872_08235 [Desulfobacterales bacterium C00003060]OEU78103.1 MAG: hypothetical protein BA865_04210 [Desulfobacterales bacterium S5133MH4]